MRKLSFFLAVCLIPATALAQTSIAPQQNSTSIVDSSTAVQNEAGTKKSWSSSFQKNRNSTAANSNIGAQVPDLPAAAGKSSKALVFCLSGVFILLYLYKHYNLKNQTGAEQNLIEVLARKPLSSKTSILLIRTEERKFLLSQNGDELALLSDLGPAANFAEKLSQLTMLEQDDLNHAAVNG